MNELSLFSGAGGGLLASKYLLGWRTVGYVEWNEYRQRVIRQRIKDGLLDEAPIFGDIRIFISEGYAERYRGLVDVITAGFPCQPFSVAGKQLKNKDHRNMWPETIEVIRAIKPESVLLENVPGVLSYLPVVIRDLRRSGYTVRQPQIIAAASLGAGHLRRRVWIYAHSNKKGFENIERESTTQKRVKIGGALGMDDGKKIFTDINQVRELQQEGDFKKQRGWSGDCRWWEAEPGVVRVVYGLADGMDRIAALGDGQVPVVAATAWKILTQGQ